jgi:hypothetical protein
MIIEVTKDCLCEHYLHELLNYYRSGLVEKKFRQGEQFEVVKDWSNFYGSYYRVIVDGKSHDISKDNCKIISR